MKQLIALSLIILPLGLNAQGKHHVFTDIGYNTSYSGSGFSATYSHKIAPRLGLGAGVQAYNDANFNRVKKAAYLDLRAYWPIKKSLLFLHGGAGVSFYKEYTRPYTRMPGKAFFSGFGFGYAYMVNKRG